MSFRAQAILAAVMVVAVLGAYYWLIHLDPAPAGSPSLQDEFYRPTPLAGAATSEPAWRRELADGVLAFRWSEVVSGEPIAHRGGVLFVLRDGRLFSRAWFGEAEYAQPWPQVDGVGALAHNTLSIAYRSSQNDPEHEFYFADCHFNISPDGKLFTCHFQQRAEPDAEGALTPGEARGERMAKLDERCQRELDLLWDFVGRVRQAGAEGSGMPHCMVLAHKHADPGITTTHEGVTYAFCCESCRKVFLADPKPFIEAARPPEPVP